MMLYMKSFASVAAKNSIYECRPMSVLADIEEIWTNVEL